MGNDISIVRGRALAELPLVGRFPRPLDPHLPKLRLHFRSQSPCQKGSTARERLVGRGKAAQRQAEIRIRRTAPYTGDAAIRAAKSPQLSFEEEA